MDQVGHCAECGFANPDPTDYLCEGCRARVCGCKVVPTMGVVPASDSRCFGGHVAENLDGVLIRHDPMRHAKDCPYYVR